MRKCVIALFVLMLAAPAAAQGRLVIIQPSQVSGVAATTLTRNQVLLGNAGYVSADVLIRITAGGTATGTLQIWVQDSCDGGTTWDDWIGSNTFALGAAVITQRFFMQGTSIPSTITTATATNITQGSAVANETMAAATSRQGPFCDRLRVREKISTPSGSPVGATYTITGMFK